MMTRTLFGTLLVATWTASAVGANCTLPSKALRPYKTDARSRQAWRESEDAVYRLMTCKGGPSDAASRTAFFSLLDLEFRRVYPPAKAEGESESNAHFQRELLAYLDEITDPRDIVHKATILRVGNARAISALGPAVYDEVMAIAGSPSDETVGLVRHSRRLAALGALGLWIGRESVHFTPQEKTAMTDVLTHALATANELPFSSQYRTMEVLIDALSHSDQPEVARVLRTWQETAPSSLRSPARAAAAAVAGNAQ